MVCDFDIMMQKKKEENRALQNKRRKAKDIDMINDNDDAIAKVLNTLFLESILLHVCVLVTRGQKNLVSRAVTAANNQILNKRDQI